MLDNGPVRYQPVSQDEHDGASGEVCEVQQATPASLSRTAVRWLWLLSIAVTALLTTAIVTPAGNHSAIQSTCSATEGTPTLSHHAPSRTLHPADTTSHQTQPTNRTAAAEPATASAAAGWSDLPSLSLLTRTYATNLPELLHLHLTYTLFWPAAAYTRSGVVLVLDEERAGDRRLGALLLHAWDGSGGVGGGESRVGVVYEALPGAGILSDKWRGSLGYCRQQYSNFYSDLYTDREFVGIVDSDAYFIRPPVPDDIFERAADDSYRPVIIGYNGNTIWCAAAEYMVGQPCAADFMVNFPVTIRRAHFAPMRQHITAHLNATSFEMAWRLMLTNVGDDHSREYSQFVIMATYLWHHHHDDYAWRINSVRQRHHKRTPKLLYDTLDEAAMSSSASYRDMATRMAQYDAPTARYMQHPFKSTAVLTDLYTTLCATSDFRAADCAAQLPASRQRMLATTQRLLYTDEDHATERPWVSAKRPSLEDNMRGVVDGVQRWHAGRWRQFEWPDREVSVSDVVGLEKRSDGKGEPFIFRPHHVTYNATENMFWENEETPS